MYFGRIHIDKKLSFLAGLFYKNPDKICNKSQLSKTKHKAFIKSFVFGLAELSANIHWIDAFILKKQIIS